MIRFADESLYPAVRGLWDIAFGEDKAFNDHFFENIFDITNTLVYLKDGKLIAMTQMPEYEIDGVGRFTYIYGAATDPEYRGRGVMSELLSRSFELDKQKGLAGSMLIPANEGLFDFYARFGYEKAFYIGKAEYKACTCDIRPADVNDCSLLNEIYEKALKNIPHPKRSPEYWSRQIKMFNALGGYVYMGERTYAFGWGGEHPGIQEIMGEDPYALAGAVAEIKKMPCITASGIGNTMPLGVVKMYNGQKKDMYFNLMYN